MVIGSYLSFLFASHDASRLYERLGYAARELTIQVIITTGEYFVVIYRLPYCCTSQTGWCIIYGRKEKTQTTSRSRI